MPQSAEDAVILVPGLMGFGSFGKPPDLLSYFDQVCERLSAFTGWPAQRFFVHEPPPTGPLEWRVHSLYLHIRRLMDEGLPSGEPLGRIHLIGHSTGGCDIRLLLNERFSWPDPPTVEARRELVERVGAAVTLSAPLSGTPIARRLRGTMEAAIPVLYALSILGKRPHHLRLRTKIASTALGLLRLVQHQSTYSGVRALVATALPPAAAAEVAAFLDKIIRDHELVHDLTVFAMHRLNAAVREADRHPLRCYVSVSPAPGLFSPLRAGSPLRALQSALYAFAYWNAHPDAEQTPSEVAPFPKGEWIGGTTSAWLATEYASDGVVTASSQTLDGTAAGIVEGDHLDVVGHFASKRFPGVTVFKSAAAFDDERFDALWKQIAEDLVAASAAAQESPRLVG